MRTESTHHSDDECIRILKDPTIGPDERTAATTQLYMNYSWLVPVVLRNYPFPDQVTSNNVRMKAAVGLITAIEKINDEEGGFDETKAKFSTYAAIWINKNVRAALRDLQHLIIINDGSSPTTVTNSIGLLVESHNCDKATLDLDEITSIVHEINPSIELKTILGVVNRKGFVTEFGGNEDDEDYSRSSNYEEHVPYVEDYDKYYKIRLLKEAYRKTLSPKEQSLFRIVTGFIDDNGIDLNLCGKKMKIRELAEMNHISYEGQRQRVKAVFKKVISYCKGKYGN